MIETEFDVFLEICRAIRARGLSDEDIAEIATDLCNTLTSLGPPSFPDSTWFAEIEEATGTAIEFINWCIVESPAENTMRGEGAQVAFALGCLQKDAAMLYEKRRFTEGTLSILNLSFVDLGTSLLGQDPVHMLRLCKLFGIPVKKEWEAVKEKECLARGILEMKRAKEEAARKAERTDEWYEELAARIIADAWEADRKISTSLIQRRYSVGFGIACRIIDLLKAAGCIETLPFKRHEFHVVQKYQ